MALNPKRGWLVACAFLGAIAIVGSSDTQSVSARTRVIGSDRIVSFDSSLDPADGPMCPYPGYATSAAATALFQQQQGADSGPPPAPPDWPPIDMGKTGPVVRTRAGAFDRAPVRFLRDGRPAFSAIAVNAENNIVLVADENNGRIIEYSRLDNTRPGAPPTRPRRVIEGLATHSEMPCAIYLDPETLETRIVNNDTQNWMPIFSREAQGNAKPNRILPTPQSSWGLAVDEVHKEMYVTVQGPDAVVVYRKNAANLDVPLRILEGDETQLADTHGVTVDARNDLLIVANQGTRRLHNGTMGTLRPYDEWSRAWQRSMWNSGTGGLNSFVSMFQGSAPEYGRYELPSINIFTRTASGNTAPLRVIKGPRTQLNWPSTVAVHEARGEIFVANDANDSVLVFKVTDTGDVAPTRTIKGPRTRVLNPTGVALDITNNEVWVASMGNYTLTAFPLTADGDVAPTRLIRGAPEGGRFNMVGNPGAVGYDSRRQEILVPN